MARNLAATSVRVFGDSGRRSEAAIKEQTKATVRCIPIGAAATPGKCIFTGADTDVEVLFAQAY